MLCWYLLPVRFNHYHLRPEEDQCNLIKTLTRFSAHSSWYRALLQFMQQQLTLMSFADRPACWIGTLKSVSAATNYEVITGFFQMWCVLHYPYQLFTLGIVRTSCNPTCMALVRRFDKCARDTDKEWCSNLVICICTPLHSQHCEEVKTHTIVLGSVQNCMKFNNISGREYIRKVEF